jgi:hypothetical protein
MFDGLSIFPIFFLLFCCANRRKKQIKKIDSLRDDGKNEKKVKAGKK